jgi:hypothetical protein
LATFDSASQQVVQVLNSVAQYWRGYRFVIASADIKALGIIGAGVTTITFPTISSSVRAIPSLSDEEIKIPTKLTYSPMILTATVSRTGGLYNFMLDTINNLKGNTKFEPFTLSIAEYESSTLFDLIPLKVWVVEGCIPSFYTPPSADSVSSPTKLPTESLTLEIKRIYQLPL